LIKLGGGVGFLEDRIQRGRTFGALSNLTSLTMQPTAQTTVVFDGELRRELSKVFSCN